MTVSRAESYAQAPPGKPVFRSQFKKNEIESFPFIAAPPMGAAGFHWDLKMMNFGRHNFHRDLWVTDRGHSIAYHLLPLMSAMGHEWTYTSSEASTAVAHLSEA